MKDQRFKQAEYEAKWALTLTIAYIIVWGITGYCLSLKPGIFGFPIWFEFACLFTPITFIILCILLIYKKFYNIPLDS